MNDLKLWKRFIPPVLLALFFGLLITLQSLFREPVGWVLYGIFWMTLTTIAIWEANLFIGRRLDARLSWNRQLFQRLVVQLLLSYLVSILIFLLSYIGLNAYETQILNKDNALGVVHLASAAALGLMLTTFIDFLQIGYQLIRVRESERLQAERYQRESIHARLESLKQQIDPHFLFNNFSTLYGMIHEDQERAAAFLLKLSDVYRLVLDHLDRDWVTVSEELALVRVYTELLCIRYGAALEIRIELPEAVMERQVIPFALQLLVENAIKHNRIEPESPLQIRLGLEPAGGGIYVENDLIPRTSKPVSARIGLKNLEERYRHRLGKPIRIAQDRRHFTVVVPL